MVNNIYIHVRQHAQQGVQKLLMGCDLVYTIYTSSIYPCGKY
jgi:hypothetical protein